MEQQIPGFCALCRSRCGCISTVVDGKLVAVDPDPFHPTGGDPLGLPGYDAEGAGAANYNNLIDATVGDPISGTMALRSSLCEVRRAAE
jgi:hypothetical protein